MPPKKWIPSVPSREEERQQLAAELHDVVAKDLTVITMLAGSLRLNTANEALRVDAEDRLGQL
jgi:signal transduction histidine kinase